MVIASCASITHTQTHPPSENSQILLLLWTWVCACAFIFVWTFFYIVLWVCVCLYLTVLAFKQRRSYNKGLSVHSLSFYPIYQTWGELSGERATPNSPGSEWRSPTPPNPPLRTLMLSKRISEWSQVHCCVNEEDRLLPVPRPALLNHPPEHTHSTWFKSSVFWTVLNNNLNSNSRPPIKTPSESHSPTTTHAFHGHWPGVKLGRAPITSQTVVSTFLFLQATIFTAELQWSPLCLQW